MKCCDMVALRKIPTLVTRAQEDLHFSPPQTLAAAQTFTGPQQTQDTAKPLRHAMKELSIPVSRCQTRYIHLRRPS